MRHLLVESGAVVADRPDPEKLARIQELDPSRRLSPSRIVGCPRGAFFESLGYHKPISFELQAIFDYGNERHKAIQEARVASGRLREVETWMCHDDPPILGRKDGVEVVGGQDAVWDLKTTGKWLHDLRQPFRSNVQQIMLYMIMGGYNMGVLEYESKQGLDVLPEGATIPTKRFEVAYDPYLVNQVLGRARMLYTALQARRVPWPDTWCKCENPACWDKAIIEREAA